MQFLISSANSTIKCSFSRPSWEPKRQISNYHEKTPFKCVHSSDAHFIKFYHAVLKEWVENHLLHEMFHQKSLNQLRSRSLMERPLSTRLFWSKFLWTFWGEIGDGKVQNTICSKFANHHWKFLMTFCGNWMKFFISFEMNN